MLKFNKDYYFVFVVLFSGLALSFYRSHFGPITLFLVGAFFFRSTILKPTKSLLVALLIWFSYFAINTAIIKSFHPFFMATYIIYIYIAWWLTRYYKTDIFNFYSSVIYYLSLISLFFWLWEFISPSSLTQIMTVLNVAGDSINSISVFVYTKHYLAQLTAFPRNAGFTWEPGPFSCFVALALFFNMAKNQVTFKDTKRVVVFITAIITTQSTTGLLLLLSLLAWYSWARFENKAFRILLVPIVVAFVAIVYFNVPFLNDKIEEQSQQDVYTLIDHAKISGKTYNPGRFASLQLRYEDFKNYPVAGYGGNPKLQYGYLGEGNVVSAVSGIGKVFGQYGLIGSLIFLFLLFRAGKFIADYYNYSGFLIFPLMIFIIGFSFSIIETPIIISFLLLPFFIKSQRQRPVAV